jgi:hypothetical protein
MIQEIRRLDQLSHTKAQYNMEHLLRIWDGFSDHKEWVTRGMHGMRAALDEDIRRHGRIEEMAQEMRIHMGRARNAANPVAGLQSLPPLELGSLNGAAVSLAPPPALEHPIPTPLQNAVTPAAALSPHVSATTAATPPPAIAIDNSSLPLSPAIRPASTAVDVPSIGVAITPGIEAAQVVGITPPIPGSLPPVPSRYPPANPDRKRSLSPSGEGDEDNAAKRRRS